MPTIRNPSPAEEKRPELHVWRIHLSFCPTEAEWTEWFDRDDERGSGDWEKLSDLHQAFPDRLCSSPLDIQVHVFLQHVQNQR